MIYFLGGVEMPIETKKEMWITRDYKVTIEWNEAGITVKLPFLCDLEKVPTDEREKKPGINDSLWDPEMQKRVNKYRKINKKGLPGMTILNSDRYSVRFGVTGAVFSKSNGFLLSQFTSDHPTSPGLLSPASGIWTTDCANPFQGALNELGQEMIIEQDNQIGHWIYRGNTLSLEWTIQYRLANNKQAGGPSIYIELADDYPKAIFQFGGTYEVEGLLAFSPNGGIEIIIPLEILGSISQNIQFVDGEKIEAGYRRSQVVWSKDLTNSVRKVMLTEKVKVLWQAFPNIF
ncbi:MAG: hypothetical protein PHN39_00965 [Candidatus Pacebacteria bacterium]|nr:hypothetical protein [Candidatus Paceibacterota bacterium]